MGPTTASHLQYGLRRTQSQCTQYPDAEMNRDQPLLLTATAFDSEPSSPVPNAQSNEEDTLSGPQPVIDLTAGVNTVEPETGTKSPERMPKQ